MYGFTMNGYFWEVKTVSSTSGVLIDRTNTKRVATTDPKTHKVYLSEDLLIDSSFLYRVLVHELSHCVIFSYNLFEEIHKMVYPEYWIEAEEFLCNFVADYGLTVFNIAKSYLGDAAIDIIPKELERLVA